MEIEREWRGTNLEPAVEQLALVEPGSLSDAGASDDDVYRAILVFRMFLLRLRLARRLAHGRE